MTQDQIDAIDPQAEYDVTLARLVIVAGVRFRPRDAHQMRGDFLKRVIEEHGAHVVASAVAR